MHSAKFIRGKRKCAWSDFFLCKYPKLVFSGYIYFPAHWSALFVGTVLCTIFPFVCCSKHLVCLYSKYYDYIVCFTSSILSVSWSLLLNDLLHFTKFCVHACKWGKLNIVFCIQREPGGPCSFI